MSLDENQAEIDRIFGEALAIPSERRSSFLRDACTSLPAEVRREVEQLIEVDDQAANESKLVVSPINLRDILPDANLGLIAGNEIGPYRITRQIGAGGFGQVYEAVRKNDFAQKVAIKLTGRNASPSVLARFELERQVLAQLTHENIARLLDGGQTVDGQPYFVMEHIDGEPITRYCDNNKLTIQERLQLFLEVCRAVSYAHQLGIIHRDLKPSNILVTSSGVPKLLDFGVAKLTDAWSRDTYATVTHTGLAPMTPEYASPEQAAGKMITTASDSYALGVVLYELLVGTRPYDIPSSHPVEVADAILRADVSKPSTAVLRAKSLKHGTDTVATTICEQRSVSLVDLTRRVAGDLDAIVMKALRKDCSSRYSSAGQLADDLQRFFDGLPVEARKGHSWYHTQKFLRRNRVAVGASLFICLALVVATVGLSIGLRSSIRLQAELTSALGERHRAWQSAQVRTEELRRERYVQDMKMAYLAWNDDWSDEVGRLLAKQVPMRQETDLRGFEWGALRRLSEQPAPIELRGHDGAVRDIAVFGDGKRLASVGDDGKICIWDLTENQLEFVLCDERPRVKAGPQFGVGFGFSHLSVAISPDDRWLVTGNVVLTLWDLKQRRLVRDLSTFPTRIHGIAFSPDGTMVAAQSHAKVLRVVTIQGELLYECETNLGDHRLQFSPDGKRLAAGYQHQSDSSGVWLWDTDNWERTNFGAFHDLNGLAYSAESKYVFLAGWINSLHLLNVETGETLARSPTQRSQPNDVALSPDSCTLAATFLDGSVCHWKLSQDWQAAPSTAFQTRKVARLVHKGQARSVRFVDDHRIATCGDDGVVKILSTSTESIARQQLRSSVTYSPNTGRFMVARPYGFAWYDPRTRRFTDSVDLWKSKEGGPISFGVSPRGLIAVGSDVGNVVIWDVQNEHEIHRFSQTIGRGVHDIAFSPDGRWMANASTDHTVRIRSTADWMEVYKLDTLGQPTVVRFSPSGNSLAFAEGEGSLFLLDVPTWRVLATADTRIAVSNRSLKFTSDGETIVTGHVDSFIRTWHAKSLVKQDEMIGHTQQITDLAVHPHQPLAATTSYDGTVRLWYVDPLTQVGVLKAFEFSTVACDFSSDGSRLLVLELINYPDTHRMWEVVR